MVPDVHGESTICNIYYDTPDYRLISRSLEKPVYKEKLRMRSYGPAKPESPVFLELKKKYQGVVYKRRISLPEWGASAYMSGALPLTEDSQIGREIDYFRSYYGQLRPSVYLSYERCASYAAEDETLRATFDKNICWRNENMSLEAPAGGRHLLLPRQSLLEIKTASAIPLWLVQALEKAEVRQASFSKYGEAYIQLCRDTADRRGVDCA